MTRTMASHVPELAVDTADPNLAKILAVYARKLVIHMCVAQQNYIHCPVMG